MKLYSTKQVQEILGLSWTTLRRWREKGKGPKWIKMGFLIRYPESDLQEYIDSMRPAKEETKYNDTEEVKPTKAIKKEEATTNKDEFDFWM